MSLKEMREELRALRKESVKPVSRMKKGDISAELQKLKSMREETPASAAVPSAPLRKSRSAVETIKEAKAKEFPVAPEKSVSKGTEKPKKVSQAAPKKKESKMEKLMRMVADEMTTDEE